MMVHCYGAMLCLLILAAGGSLAQGSSCTDNSATASRNVAWVRQQLYYREALGKRKERAEANCNTREADKYWQEAFLCPDFSAVSCLNGDARGSETDSFNCQLSVCSDGFYSDQGTFTEIWRNSLNTDRTKMSIYTSKLFDCSCTGRACMEYNATQLKAGNNVAVKYHEISVTHTDPLKELEEKSEALSEKQEELSKAVLEVIREIEVIGNKSVVWDALKDTCAVLSTTVTDATDQIDQLEKRSESWDALIADHSKLSDAVVEAIGKIRALDDRSTTWDDYGEKYSELSTAMTEANDQIKGLRDNTEARSVLDRTVTEELVAAKDKITSLEKKLDLCAVTYGGKCFWAEVNYNRMNYDQAKKMCTDKGAKLADIYSKEHYYMLMSHLRTVIDDSGYINAWTGLSYIPRSRSVALSDGNPAPYVQWWGGNNSRRYCCSMLLRVTRNFIGQHLHNADKRHKMRAAICEL